MEFSLDDLRRALDRQTIILAGPCTVEYHGRARSVAPECTRLVIVKPDGSVLVHEGSKREPVNWQPPGTRVILSRSQSHPLIVRAERRRPRETLEVRFTVLTLVSTVDLGECSSEFKLYGSERDIVRLILENPSLVEPGFRVLGVEVETSAGKIDLLGRDAAGRLVVVEVKRSKAQLQHVSQLKRYVDHYAGAQARTPRGLLLAPGITPAAEKLLERYGLEYRDVSQLLEWAKGRAKVRR